VLYIWTDKQQLTKLASELVCVCVSVLSVHSLHAASEADKQQLTKLASELAAEGEKRRQAADMVKRLSRKLLLVSKVP